MAIRKYRWPSPCSLVGSSLKTFSKGSLPKNLKSQLPERAAIANPIYKYGFTGDWRKEPIKNSQNGYGYSCNHVTICCVNAT